MKASKFIVLFAGVIGIAAFFLPLIAAPGASAWSSSAFQIVRELGDTRADERADVLSYLVLAAFGTVPTCALFGLIGVITRRFARGLGTGALLFGAIGSALWVILDADISELSAKLGAGGFELKSSVGMSMLLVCFVGCALGGLLALVSPDRGDVAPPRYAETIKA